MFTFLVHGETCVFTGELSEWNLYATQTEDLATIV